MPDIRMAKKEKAMNSAVSKSIPSDPTYLMKLLLVLIFIATSGLSIKAAYDLAKYSDLFPIWFVPGFALGIIILLGLSCYFVFQASKTGLHPDRLSRGQSVFLWAAMAISFLCTTSVHGFYPFHPNTLSILPYQDSIMKTNYVLAVAGFTACILLASLYTMSQMKLPAMTGLMLVALILLVPNDNCSNPFNYWWIDTIGASPLMYVPNMYAALFAVCGLNGIHPKVVSLILPGVCVASLALGLGHQFGIIW